jgi:4-diphosphocytidyl-2-C-methyl-D-erythritol kinase
LSAPTRLVLRAPAKVNLTLAVGARRPDGFHEVDTVCLALELGDLLEVRRGPPGDGLRLIVEGPQGEGVPSDGSNLAWRAARIVQERARALGRTSSDLELRLEKHVPSAAGLGGGSSDAAAALLGASLALGLEPDDPELVQALGTLGSDCPFFLVARATGLARCTGRGERVAPLSERPPFWVVVLTPALECATGEVYAALAAAPRTSQRRPALDLARPATIAHALHNDLASAACTLEPRLAEIAALLQEIASDRFLLSGSGSSFFALALEVVEAQRLEERVRAAMEARRFAIRGLWVTRAAGHGVREDAAKSQYPYGPAP